MNWDESLFRAINGFAGQVSFLDWLAETLSAFGTLRVPGILLAGYWCWLSWREALLAAPVLAGRKLRGGVRVSLESRAEYGDRSGILSSALSAIRLGELAGGRTDRACAGLYRSALCDRCAGWVAHWWVLWSGSGVAPVAVAKVSSTIRPAIDAQFA